MKISVQDLAHSKGVPAVVTEGMLALQSQLIAALDKVAPQRQPLTDEEIQAIHDTYYRRMGPQEFARAIEAAHGIGDKT